MYQLLSRVVQVGLNRPLQLNILQLGQAVCTQQQRPPLTLVYRLVYLVRTDAWRR